MATSDELLQPYAEAASLAEAEAALTALAPGPDLPAILLADCCDDLATEACDLHEFDAAVRLERRAIELGCTHQWTARTMLPWYLMRDGQTVAAEAEFAALCEERPADVDLLVTMGNARFDGGQSTSALAAFDEAVALAKDLDLPDELDYARIERRAVRQELGLDSDEDDRAMEAPHHGAGDRIAWTLAWFPPDEHAAALERWPELAEDLEDPGYAARIEAHLRELRLKSGHLPTVAPLGVEDLTAWAAAHGRDPDSGEARSGFAAEVARTGGAIPWPPGRNEPCWCGSDRKYKRCCGAL